MNSDDWKDVDFEAARSYVHQLFHDGSVDYYEALNEFILKVELLREKQLKEANKNIPAILRK